MIEKELLDFKPDTNTKKPIIFGLTLLLLGFGSFLLWAFIAPLDQGISGTGTVRISGERKEVQALTGGAIESLKVREGDLVSENQVLIQLSKVQAESQLNIIMTQWSIARATQIRLQAEQTNKKEISWPIELTKLNSDPRINALIELQNQQFQTRKSEFESTLAILNRNLDGLKEQLNGYITIKKSHNEQLNFQTQELMGLKDLAKDGYVARNKLLEAERNSAQLTAQLAEDLSNIGKTQQLIAETQLKILLNKQTFRKEVETQLSDVSKDVNSLADRLKSAQFEVEHTEIKSPTSGQIVGLKVHTDGGVLSAGQHIMDIVPNNSPLIVEAKFSSIVLDKLKPGLKVDLHFSSLNRVETPKLEGEVRTVSADQLIDDATRQPYFVAEITLTPKSLNDLKQKKIDIRPGMPVDAVVITGERTMINYLIKPFSRRVLSSFKED
ncbi:HlyD family type I secretion periplasmic adaptor subunit [uncultured Tolumonas sp.]|uniref:HlyD family type I secretion periplasmic adaptor subunit n=1 Tax=uncultured Tolumonas sp. TaxID=263765 RepID=UPI00292D07DE|nr:HlyD family type I secretion periplasmic adaptor subunit [uncultured Tolumonas sp.]